MKHTVFITGGSGYVGSLLVADFVERDDVEKIIFLDRKNPPNFINKIMKENSDRIFFIKDDMLNLSWQEKVSSYEPDIVIHCAWQIRSSFKNEKEQWLGNILGTENVFNFAFENKSVEKFIHFSTVASYSAEKANELSKIFTEEDILRDSDFRYAYEKKEAEDRLYAKYCREKSLRSDLDIFVVRPASITGAHGKSLSKFGLQSVLSGKSENYIHKLISKVLFFAPLTRKWARQFVHESDVVGVVRALSFYDKNKNIKGYEVFNICPPGDPMTARDMANTIGKKLLLLNPQIIRVLFFTLWHGTRGVVPTSRGAWKSYCYPIVVDGSKITKVCGYEYKYGPQESFIKD